MSGKINMDLKSLKLITDRNRPYIPSIIIILVCIILFWQFIIPQFEILSTAQEEVRQAELRLQTLKENLNVLTNTDEKSLDMQLKILNLALPLNKDFSGILNSIYYAAQKTGVNLGSFSLQIGNLLDSEKKDDFPTISLSIPMNANVAAVNSFVEVISKTAPLSEVTLIKIKDINSVIELSFYYKPLGFSNYKEDTRIVPLTQKGLTIINKLSSFENASSFPKVPVATSSSEKNSNPL